MPKKYKDFKREYYNSENLDKDFLNSRDMIFKKVKS